MAEMVKTGVPGLDTVLHGGITRRSSVLVSGNPGTGKSILGQQFVYTGAAEHDELGLYLSFEESRRELGQTAGSVGLDRWDELVADGQIDVFDKRDLIKEEDVADTVDVILQAIHEGSYDRLVVDSLTIFGLFFEGERKRRQYLLKFVDILKENDITSILTHEQSATFPKTNIGLENYLTDGNIYLIQTPTDAGVNRYIWVAKMRKQDIETDIFPMEIAEGGIQIHESASEFSLMSGDGSPL